MKFEFNQFENPETIKPSHVHRMNIDFLNMTSTDAELPPEYFTPSSYKYTVENGMILGSRSCLVNGQVYLDTPAEWSRKEFLSYIGRVKSIHSREFGFVENYYDEHGEGQLRLPRPYLHLDEEIFFCGSVEFWNFGFFLTVLMQKVFLATAIDSQRPVLVPICAQWQVTLLRTFFPDTRFIFYDPVQVVSVARATVVGWPGFGFQICGEYLAYLRKMIGSIGDDGAVDRSLLYFVRRDGIFAKRFEMVNLLNSFLLSKGYTPIHPELLMPKRIAKMVNGSRAIILDSGSALFNLIFANPETEVILFESRTDFLLNHARFINSCGLGRSKILFVDPESSLAEVKRNINFK